MAYTRCVGSKPATKPTHTELSEWCYCEFGTHIHLSGRIKLIETSECLPAVWREGEEQLFRLVCGLKVGGDIAYKAPSVSLGLK
jgi:hypothetical protein